MATQVKHRRGTQSEVDGFTPAIGEIVMNTSEDELVLGNGAKQGGIPIPKKKGVVLRFDTLSDALANNALKEGFSISVTERESGEGGGSTWDVVTTASVTPNDLNIVQCIGVTSLSLVLQIGAQVDANAFGATTASDATSAIQAALSINGYASIKPGDYTVSSDLDGSLYGFGDCNFIGGNVTYRNISTSQESQRIFPAATRKFSEQLLAPKYPQALAVTSKYWFIAYDNGTATPPDLGAVSLKRIDRDTLVEEESGLLLNTHGQGIGVVSDDVVLTGGDADDIMMRYNFDTGIQDTITATGIRPDYPLAVHRGIAYQLQNRSTAIDSADFEFIHTVNLATQVTGQINLPRHRVKETMQGMTVTDDYIYITTGGAYTGDASGNKNQTTVITLTKSGEQIGELTMLKTGFSRVFNNQPITTFEAQSIYWFNNSLYRLDYMQDASNLDAVISQMNVDGEEIETFSPLKMQQFVSLADIGITDDDIGLNYPNEALVDISNAMSNYSRLDITLDSTTPRILTAFDIASGTLSITKFNPFRISCLLTDLSEASVTGQPSYANAYVFDGNPSFWTYTNSTGVLKYDGDSVANTNYPIGLLDQASKIQIWVTDGTTVKRIDFTKEDIATQIAIGRNYVVDFGGGNSFEMSWSGNSDLVTSNSAGTARVRRIYRY